MQILVRPSLNDYLGNQLFEGASDYTSGEWLKPFIEISQRLAKSGIAIKTWDMAPLSTADVVLFQDLPATPAAILEAKQKAPQAKFVLMLFETPLSRRHAHLHENHHYFDAVLTYNKSVCDEERYFHYQLPVSPPAGKPEDPAFEDRTPLVLINTNRPVGPLGLLARRGRGWAGVPTFGPRFGGWHLPMKSLLKQTEGELYTARWEIAKWADKHRPESLRIYGRGWQGEEMSWLHRFVKAKPVGIACGPLMESKQEVLPKYRFALAYENMVGRLGYISEKLFDPIFAGVVPIYLGEENIFDDVPSDCFIDAREFQTPRDLFDHIDSVSKHDWETMREAGRKFLVSTNFYPFTPKATAIAIEKCCRKVCNT